MGNEKKIKPIRLSNRTAIALRKAAQRVRNTWLIAMGVVTMLVVVIALYLGMLWLPAVPLTFLVAACLLTVMMITSRSQYLLLISQAICTEAASRQMEERKDENARRKRAIEQLAAMRADVREAERKDFFRQDGRTEESLLFDLLTGRESMEMRAAGYEDEDEELYASSHKMNETDDEDDLHPVKKPRISSPAPVRASAFAQAAPVTQDATKQIRKIIPEQNQKETGAQPQNAPRRRRRSVPAETTPLTLLKGDQAQ